VDFGLRVIVVAGLSDLLSFCASGGCDESGPDAEVCHEDVLVGIMVLKRHSSFIPLRLLGSESSSGLPVCIWGVACVYS
jgi:hypothetical protein